MEQPIFYVKHDVQHLKSNHERNLCLKKHESKIHFNIPNTKKSDQQIQSNTNLSSLDTKRGGLLRLNSETMKLLNGNQSALQTIKKNTITKTLQELAEQMRVEMQHISKLNHLQPKLAYFRHRLMSHLESIFFLNFDYECNENLSLVWNQCFYSFINFYRLQIKSDVTTVGVEKNAFHHLNLILREGVVFFQSLLQKIFQKFNCSIQTLIKKRKNEENDSISYCVAKILVYLGDLERYCEANKDQSNFTLSTSYYTEAHLIAPKWEHTSSILALLYHYQKNLFQSLYYSVRCINTLPMNGIRPTSISKQQRLLLIMIFSEGGDKFKLFQSEWKKSHFDWTHQTNLKREKISQINNYERIEYWISPVDETNISKCDMNNFYDLASIKIHQTQKLELLNFFREQIQPKLSFQQCRQRFILSFIHVHGILNCRTDCDQFFDVANQMLIEFDWLINRRYKSEEDCVDERLETWFLIQLVVINVYTIHYTMSQQDESKNSDQYGFLHANSHYIMSTMMMIIMEKLVSTFENFKREFSFVLTNKLVEDNNNSIKTIDNLFELSTGYTQKHSISPELNDFFQFLSMIKIWLSWIITSSPRLPPQAQCELDLKLIGNGELIGENCWSILSHFAQLLNELEIPHLLNSPKLFNELPEDQLLFGLSWLKNVDLDKLVTDFNTNTNEVNIDLYQSILRIKSIQNYVNQLCDRKYLKYYSDNKTFKSLIGLNSYVNVSNEIAEKVENVSSSFEEYIQIRKELGFQEDDGESDSEFLIDDYENEEEMKMLSNSKIIHSLVDNSEPKRRLLIRPRYVIFDTNCFINNFAAIQKFIETSPFIVTIPLIVVHELEHIQTRGSRIVEESASNVKPQVVRNRIEIGHKAKEILNYLDMAFQKYPNGIRAVTSKGSLIKSLDYKEKFSIQNVHNNDDLVLYSCTNLVKVLPKMDFSIEDNLKRLLSETGEIVSKNDELNYHDVIMITDDNNLRLKSLCFEVPVKRLKQFLRWTRTFSN